MRLKMMATWALVISVLICSVLSFTQCHSLTNEEKETLEGQVLAKKNCSTCHQFVEPDMLDVESWTDHVLPAMAQHFGIELWSKKSYYQPPEARITYVDWMKIVRYYSETAPKTLQSTKSPRNLPTGWTMFSLKTPSADKSRIATTTNVAINTLTKTIFSSSADPAKLELWDSNLKRTRIIPLPSASAHVNFAHSGTRHLDIITCIGGMKATDQTLGDIIESDLSSKIPGKLTKINSGLIRPIHTQLIDFNRDNLTDYVVCSFGHNKGGLFLLQQKADSSFSRVSLREIPGATQSVICDINNDGWPDIIALFAHADEGIWLFTNNKKGGFETKNLLRFPAVYGSSSFQLVDLNGDGRQDILYTAGDNSDYSRILKPYHGVYIYANTGNFNFELSYFYPINGCTKAIASDFDLDGDLDIATIAFFADLKNNAPESFIYFENDHTKTSPTMNFKPVSIPISKNGRWICMDVNDFDCDGDDDIVLGNYSKGLLNQPNFKPNWDVNVPFVVLENHTK